ncbi:hypothetical protein F0919_07865 [Taibaiella lutea]|uniref:Cation/H+ exchanger transmembrane domain-containing protein n=1 Tax=Taibaiella lutea TaxID=2608001 RepID=A0A5M6CH24_9BACT|nr:cation:proton antiporter [Taibaiella lutea]KAA5534528.1 hypothetical protein F0919_07865 [Taibaiella lutea]
MTRFRNLIFYLSTFIIFSLLIYFIVMKGQSLEDAGLVKNVSPVIAAPDSLLSNLKVNAVHPLAILLLQIIVIIGLARFFGFLFKKIHQPSVIGEIIAGILLGPSFLGHWFPQVTSFIFPLPSLGNLQFLSQIGLILFMFVVGMELQPGGLKNKMKDAIVISHASIIFPFASGILLALFIYKEFAPADTRFFPFALFIGIAMSITAFPVLARIIQERGLSQTKLGNIAITCAAADDITAWCILAAVIAIVKAGSVVNAVYVLLLTIAYMLLMLKVVRPFLNKLVKRYSDKSILNRQIIAVFFITLIVSAYLTEAIGIHALFGAFMAGVIMPEKENIRKVLIDKVEDVALVLLLPLFFVFTGLRTEIGLLNTPHLWVICALVIALAVAGKFGGSAVAARFTGQSWKESLSIGALMNTRGLMELVVLNIGYDLGILPPQIFTIMVIMALATTLMTGPALNIINRLFTK